jgi:CelD/BcsL family acetyltransferase involved in cellulose biosynthesis
MQERPDRVVATHGWTLETCSTWDEAWSLGETVGWRACATGPGGHAFAHPALVRAWAETIGGAVPVVPHVVVARDGDGTTVVLPAVIRAYAGRLARRRVLEPAGGALFGYHTPIWSRGPTPDLATRFWAAVRHASAHDVHQALFRFVAPVAAGTEGTELAGDESPVLPLAGLHSLDDVLGRMSRNAREQVRRIARRLSDVGDVRLDLAHPRDGTAAAQAFRNSMVPAYRARWRAHPGGCLLDAPGVMDFFARVVEDGVSQGWAQFATLSVGEVPVAWHVGLVHATGWHWWLPAHDPERESSAPGRALLAALVARAIADRVPALHLLTGAQRYKRSWQPHPNPLCTVRWYAPGLRGTAARLYDRWRAPASGNTGAADDTP